MKSLIILTTVLFSLNGLALTAPKIEQWTCEFRNSKATGPVYGTHVNVTTEIGKSISQVVVFPMCPACMVAPRRFEAGLTQVGKTLTFKNSNESFALKIRTDNVKPNTDNSFAAATLGNKRGLCRLILR